MGHENEGMDASMYDAENRLFVGMKISAKLQREMDNCARGTERYFKEDRPESLQIVTLGEEKLIGRFLQDGFPVNEIDNVSRNIRSVVTLITQGHRIAEDSIRIYSHSMLRVGSPGSAITGERRYT
ncbi:MAG: hypothetical protein HY695_26785 [Deltaproteobacteria bacterium]|nr:hypothetical protein [Deltaproteobacteria bacterium]